jgi:hypothetical protein
MSTYVSFLPSNSLILPSQIGNAGKYLTTDGTSLSWGTPVSQTITSGVLDKSPSEDAVYQALALKVTGAASATDGTIALFDGNTGKMIRQGLGWTIDSGALCAQTDGMYNIGKASDNRPGYVYVKTTINLDSLSVSSFVGSNASKNLVSLSSATATSYLDVFQVGLKGLVPAPTVGDANNYLKGDGTWAAVVAGVTSVSASAPLSSSGGSTPNISISQASALTDGYLSSSDFSTFSSKMSNPMTTAGDIIVGGASGTPGRLALGTVDKVLVSDGTTVAYQYAGLGGGALGSGNVVIGRAKPTWTGTNGVLVGTTATSSGGDSRIVAVGTGAAVGQDGVAIGYNAAAQNTGTGNSQCVAVGASATCNGTDSVAVGYNTAVGQSGIAIGRDATVTNLGGGIAIGRGSSTSATGAGTHGIAIGYTAKAGSGQNTIVIGHGAGNQGATSTAANATIIGQGAGTAVTSASGPTIIGQGAGTSVTTQAGVTVVGYIANASGQYTTVVGRGATGKTQSTTMGYAADGGDYCTVIGYDAGGASSTGCNAHGSESQRSCSGSSNQSIGNQSLYSLTSGSNNVAIGEVAGYALTTQSGNVMLGHRAGRWGVASDEFYVGNQNYASNAVEKTDSLMYGQFNATASSQTLTVNAQVTATYGLKVSTAGYGISIKDGGANSKIGITSAFPGGGTNSVTVTNTAITANSIILITAQTAAPTANPGIWISARTNGASFTISASDNSFTGTVGYMIVDLIP